MCHIYSTEFCLNFSTEQFIGKNITFCEIASECLFLHYLESDRPTPFYPIDFVAGTF